MDPQTDYVIRRLRTEMSHLLKRIDVLEGNLRTTQLGQTSIDGEALAVTDGLGNTTQLIGIQGDGTFDSIAAGSSGPPQTTDPVVSVVPVGLSVSWDGNFASGAALPVNWDHVEIHVSTVSTFTPSAATLQGTLLKPGVHIVSPLVPGNTYYCVLVPVDTSGAQGPMSDVISGVPASVEGSIDPGSITTTMISPQAITTPLLAAGAVTTAILAAQAVAAGNIAAGAVVAGTIQANAIDGMTINAVTINGGIITGADFISVAGTGGYFAYSSGGTTVQILTAPAGTWICPPNVSQVLVESIAAGGGAGGGSTIVSNGGGGGGGGEYAAEPTYATTPGNSYNYVCGAGGAAGGNGQGGKNGGDTIFDTGGAIPVHAHGGDGGSKAFNGGTGGNGGDGSVNTISNAGGNGGNGGAATFFSTGFTTWGGGGGSAGGLAGPGNNGAGTTGGQAVPPGGPGGNGGISSGRLSGRTPVAPGGGGGATASSSGSSAAGAPGWIKLTYTATAAVLVAAVSGQAVTDPLAGVNVPAGISAFNGGLAATFGADATGYPTLTDATGFQQQAAGGQLGPTAAVGPITTTTQTTLLSTTIPGGNIEGGAVHFMCCTGSFSTGTSVPSGATFSIGYGGTNLVSLPIPGTIGASLSNVGWFARAWVFWQSTTACEVLLEVGWHTASGEAGSVFYFHPNNNTGLSTSSSAALALKFQWGSAPTGTSLTSNGGLPPSRIA